MAIPKSIEEAEKQADELMKRIQEGKDPYEVETPPAETPPAEPAAAPTSEETPAPAPVEPVQTEPVAKAPETPPAEDPNSDTWRQRYQAMDGKYKSETAPALREVTSLKMTVADLKTQIADLTSKLVQQASPKPEPPQPKPIPDKVSVLREESPEVIEAINYFIDTKVPEMVEARVQERLKEMGVQFDSKLTQFTQLSFQDKLSHRVPTWTDLNEDKGFLTWLDQKPRYSRKTKLELLRSAVADQDLESAASFFEDYIKEVTPPAAPQAATPPGPKKTIDSFVAPSTKSSAAQVNDNSDATITRRDIKEYYSDVAKGKYKGREKEAADIEAKINAAMLAGNVR